jgi:hypothetical protein
VTGEGDIEVTNDLARLPQLIEQAIAALDKATTAAEVLDVQMQAGVVYTAAKAAAQFARMKDAHDTVVNACRKVMGDALVIEARAQCRLADEYDAAQERGEVQKAGGNRKSKIIIPNENNDLTVNETVNDIGLTSKQVHAARKVRDAEKKKPGIVRMTVEQKLKTKEEPTRASINRVIEETIAPPREPVRDVRTDHAVKPAVQAPVDKPATAPPTPEQPQTGAETEADTSDIDSEEDTSDIDDAIDVLLDHLQTLEPDRQKDFVDHMLLEIGLASRRITRRDKLTWQPSRAGYVAAIMKETNIPMYALFPLEEGEELYRVGIIFPANYEILVDDDEPLPLAEAKKFAEAHHKKSE